MLLSFKVHYKCCKFTNLIVQIFRSDNVDMGVESSSESSCDEEEQEHMRSIMSSLYKRGADVARAEAKARKKEAGRAAHAGEEVPEVPEQTIASVAARVRKLHPAGFFDGGAMADAMVEANVAGAAGKRKREEKDSGTVNSNRSAEAMQPRPLRRGTLSVAVPGSIVGNAQSQELRTRLGGQIARTAAIFQVETSLCKFV